MQSWHRRYCTMRKGQKDIQLPSYNELLGIDDFVNHGADQMCLNVCMIIQQRYAM